MIKKIIAIFARDIKIGIRDFMSMMMIVIPIIMAIVVNLFSPGIEDTSVNLALIEGENTEMVSYLENYAKVQVYKNYKALSERVRKRDNVVGIIGEGSDSYILTHGNEPDEVVEYTQLLKTFFEHNRQAEDSTALIKEFGVETPPVKMLWANLGILLMTVLAGMLISLNIVDEKMDNTVSAINVTPVSQAAWIFGKSLIGILLALVGCLAMVLIMGVLGNVNVVQLLIFVAVSSLISIMIGFLEGLNSDDVLTAMASTKMIMLPLAASVAGYEFLAAKWQWVLYWSPFYWIYKGNIAILNGSMTWLNLLLTGGIVLVIAALVFVYMAPRIRQGLEH